jgi:hypothetical protein
MKNLKNVECLPHIPIAQFHNSTQSWVCHIQTSTTSPNTLLANVRSDSNKLYIHMYTPGQWGWTTESNWEFQQREKITETMHPHQYEVAIYKVTKILTSWNCSPSLKALLFLLDDVAETVSNMGSSKRWKAEASASWLKCWYDFAHIIAYQTEPCVLCIFLYNWHT